MEALDLKYEPLVLSRLDHLLNTFNLNLFNISLTKKEGKVRDIFNYPSAFQYPHEFLSKNQENSSSQLIEELDPDLSTFFNTFYRAGNHLKLIFLVASDRLSAFDRSLCAIPFKGQVLSQISAWWFQQLSHIVPNHFLHSPSPNVTIARVCKIFPIEFVVRGYLTGTTQTSIWAHYSKGERKYCGHELPEGLIKHQKLEKPLVTPTTKDEEHDQLISGQDIVSQQIMNQASYDYCAEKALTCFKYGQKVAESNGLLLVDSKYEFGIDSQGTIRLVDEVHTPDSSRYWIQSSYDDLVSKKKDPESIDKDIVRKWYAEHCNPYQDLVLPEAPKDLIVQLSVKYIQLYERITGLKFMPATLEEQSQCKIEASIQHWLIHSSKILDLNP